MNSARRWYIYLICAISLQSVAWAVIYLLRNLLSSGGRDVSFIALQIATIIVALPVFLVHWLWAQRLAENEINEREASLRGIYHYGMMAGFLGAGVANIYSLIFHIFWFAVGEPGYDPFNGYETSLFEGVLYNLIAIILCALLWFYQQRVVSDDMKSSPENEGLATMRRLYLYVFSATGLTLTTTGVVHIIRWIMFQFGVDNTSLDGWGIGYLTEEVTRLLVGVPLWLFFWRQAQSLFSEPRVSEHESALRKFYLYTTVFVAALSVVGNATGILAGLFRRILRLPSEGDIRTALPVIIGMGLLWMYHAFILKEDAMHYSESVKQGGVRRMYLYLVAGVGMAAILTGISGDLSVLIRSYSQGLGSALKEALAWFTAGLIAGLPVWLLPWRQAQNEAVELTTEGNDARRSTARKIYLYFYLFIATMTVLSGTIYILYRCLSLLLGNRGDGDLVGGIAQAFAYSVVGVGVWLYHGSVLRGDGASSKRELAKRFKDTRVALVDVGDSGFGQEVLNKLQRDELGIKFDLVSLLEKDQASMQSTLFLLSEASVIVGPWSVAVETGAVSPDIVRAVVNSSARKILIPMKIRGWDWAGIDQWNTEDLIQQTVRAVQQWADGDEIKLVRPMSIGGIISTVVGALILLILLAISFYWFF